MKKILLFIALLLPWFISTLFNYNTSFYNQLKLPFFAPPNILFIIVWTIIYILITYVNYKIFSEYGFNRDTKEYSIILIVNYILNQLFIIIFFIFNNLFLSFTVTISIFIASLWLYYETQKLYKEVSKYLYPYIIWSLFATILSLVIYFINL